MHKIEKLISDLYSNLLQRTASYEEIEAWFSLVVSGQLTIKGMIDGIVFSPESINLGNSYQTIQNAISLSLLDEEDFPYNDSFVSAFLNTTTNTYSIFAPGYSIEVDLNNGGRMEGMGIIGSISHSTGEADSATTGYVNSGPVESVSCTENDRWYHMLSFTAKLLHQGDSSFYGHKVQITYGFYASHIDVTYCFYMERNTSKPHEEFYMWDMALDVEDIYTHYSIDANLYKADGDAALYLLHPSGYIPLGSDWFNREIPEFETYPWTGEELPEVAKNAGVSIMAENMASPWMLLYSPCGIGVLRKSFEGFDKLSIYSNPHFSNCQSCSLELFHTNGYFMDQNGVNRPYEGDGINLALRDIDTFTRNTREVIVFGHMDENGDFIVNYKGTGPNG